MRRNQYLITNDVVGYMVEYEVCRVLLPFLARSTEGLSLLQASGDPDVIGRLVLLLADWYFAWAPGGEYVSSSANSTLSIRLDLSPSRLGHTISSAYIVNFQTHLFSVLPANFAGGFKKLLAATLAFFTEGATPDIPMSAQDAKLWPSFELLGLADRYEYIEAHVLGMSAGKWDEPVLVKLREWMADKVVPWMLLPYARGAKTS
jgi:anaphase-promoting complex subunit 2